jgi:hypothetical protein
MPPIPVFQTAKDSTADVEIANVGVAGADQTGGVPVQQAAKTMHELQAKNDDGTVKTDEDGNPVALTGAALRAAAVQWATDRGLEVNDLSDKKIAALAQDAGALPERPPAAEVAEQAYASLQVDAVDPDVVAVASAAAASDDGHVDADDALAARQKIDDTPAADQAAEGSPPPSA